MPHNKTERAGLAVALASAIVSVIALVRRQPQPNQEVSSSDNKHKHSDEEQSACALHSNKPEGWDREESEHHRTERCYWRASLAITIIAALGAGASAWFAWGAVDDGHKTLAQATTQASEAVKQTNLTALASRPYVMFKLDSSLVNPVSPTLPGRTFYQIRFHLINFGNVPAVIDEVTGDLDYTPDIGRDPTPRIVLDLTRPMIDEDDTIRTGMYLTVNIASGVFVAEDHVLENAQTYMNVAQHRSGVYFGGIIIYSGALNAGAVQRYTTSFCFHVGYGAGGLTQVEGKNCKNERT